MNGVRKTLVIGYAMAFAAFAHVLYQTLGGHPNILGLSINFAVGLAFGTLLTRGAR